MEALRVVEASPETLAWTEACATSHADQAGPANEIRVGQTLGDGQRAPGPQDPCILGEGSRAIGNLAEHVREEDQVEGARTEGQPRTAGAYQRRGARAEGGAQLGEHGELQVGTWQPS